MKKTVIFEKIDGHDIIIGFDNPTIDPVETNKIVSEAIKDTPEYQALEAKKAEYSAACKDRSEAIESKDDAKYKSALAAMSVRQDELKPLATDLDAKIISLRREKAVYFEPRVGEVVIDASQVETLSQLIQARQMGELIALDGSVVHDNRGSVFYRKSGGKWGRTHIVKLGDKIPGDAVIESDLSDTDTIEVERDRISALNSADKLKEKDVAIEDIENGSLSMRSMLEIKSDPDALSKTQAWYQDEMKKVGDRYG